MSDPGPRAAAPPGRLARPGHPALTPNTKVIVNGFGMTPWDLDTVDESEGGPVYGAITSDSYHPGGVNILLGDGSVRFIKDSANGTAWRALGTIAGGEVISSDAF